MKSCTRVISLVLAFEAAHLAHADNSLPSPAKRSRSGALASLPPAAADVVQRVRRAAAHKKISVLRPFLAPDFSCYGEDPGKDSLRCLRTGGFNVLVEVIDAGCEHDRDRRVIECRQDWEHALGRGYEYAEFSKHHGQWRLIAVGDDNRPSFR